MTDRVDALVIFGATGDLAKLETFPALVGTPAELSQRVADLKTEVWALQPGVPVGW